MSNEQLKDYIDTLYHSILPYANNPLFAALPAFGDWQQFVNRRAEVQTQSNTATLRQWARQGLELWTAVRELLFEEETAAAGLHTHGGFLLNPVHPAMRRVTGGSIESKREDFQKLFQQVNKLRTEQNLAWTTFQRKFPALQQMWGLIMSANNNLEGKTEQQLDRYIHHLQGVLNLNQIREDRRDRMTTNLTPEEGDSENTLRRSAVQLL